MVGNTCQRGDKSIGRTTRREGGAEDRRQTGFTRRRVSQQERTWERQPLSHGRIENARGLLWPTCSKRKDLVRSRKMDSRKQAKTNALPSEEGQFLRENVVKGARKKTKGEMTRKRSSNI